MSPKTIVLISVGAFALLCAVTLAYYLPKLRPQTAVPPGPVAAGPGTEAAADSDKPDIDRVLVQSIPLHPDEAASPTPPADEGAKASPPTGMAAAPSPTAAPATPPPVAAAPPAPTKPAQAPATPAPNPKLLELLKQPPIQFEISSATLTPASRIYLDKVASLLQQQAQIRLSIEGHTDSQDRLAKNQTLSEARAKAVLDYLVSKGIAKDRLESAGYGGSRPVADNASAAGRAKNRRIEFKIRD